MNCWHCERPAHAGCVYCGRNVCREHVRTMPHPLATYRDHDDRLMALVTPEAVHCGHCAPHGRPVHLSELDGCRTVDGTAPAADTPMGGRP